LLGLHSPQHYRNPIGKFNFGESRNTQFQESNYDDVTHVEYRRVLPVELHSRLHRHAVSSGDWTDQPTNMALEAPGQGGSLHRAQQGRLPTIWGLFGGDRAPAKQPPEVAKTKIISASKTSFPAGQLSR
jgi:hypothetical protein